MGQSESQAEADVASATTSLCISSNSSGAASSEGTSTGDIVFADTSSDQRYI